MIENQSQKENCGGAVRWQIKSIHCESRNEKNQVTQERLHSEERKRGRTPGSTKEVAEREKTIEKPRQKKSSKQF
jgi:hypothetical protein